MTLYARFAAHLDTILDGLEGDGGLAPGLDRKAVAVEPPRDPSHGDLATNAAMVLAKRSGTSPRALAELIAPRLSGLDGFSAGLAAEERVLKRFLHACMYNAPAVAATRRRASSPACSPPIATIRRGFRPDGSAPIPMRWRRCGRSVTSSPE